MSKATPKKSAAPDPTQRKRTGRPLLWTQERRDSIVTLVCDHVASGGNLLDVCPRAVPPDQQLGNAVDVPDARPAVGTFLAWLLPDAPGGDAFNARYTRAKELRITHDEEQVRRSAFDGTNDLTLGPNGMQTNTEVIQRSRLIVDTLKWILERRRSNLYGPKVDVTSDGKQIGTVALPGYVPLGAPLDAADLKPTAKQKAKRVKPR